MADRPIIFSAPMIRALLDGRKTQTRRVLKHQPEEHSKFAGFYSVPLSGAFQCKLQGETKLHTQRMPYAPGDRLWVREAWISHEAYDDLKPSEMGGEEPVRYLADGETQTWGWPDIDIPGRYRHARYMPRWASRLTLTVTDVRVQRLQEISEADAWAEGLGSLTVTTPKLGATVTCRDGFRDLWNILHGAEAWAANPWVVALTFSVHCNNIDQMRAA